jgi:hypothetical protein
MKDARILKISRRTEQRVLQLLLWGFGKICGSVAGFMMLVWRRVILKTLGFGDRMILKRAILARRFR